MTTKKTSEIPFISWDADLETGVENIDSQHKSIINKINEIYIACNQGNSQKEVISALIFLENYTKTHFRDEELLQLECHYPKYKLHKASHDKFIDEVKKLLDKFYKEGTTVEVLLNVIDSTTNWIKTHINKEDKEFSLYYKNYKNYNNKKS